MPYLKQLAESFDAVLPGLAGAKKHISIPTDAQPAILAALSQELESKTLLVHIPSISDAEDLTKELQAWLGAEQVAMLPAWETLPFERVSPSIEVMGKRLAIFDRLINSDSKNSDNKAETLKIVVIPTRAMLQKSSASRLLNIPSLKLEVGKEYDRDSLLDWLAEQGYRREIQVSARGEMAVRGGIVDVFASAPIATNLDEPLRIEFFGDQIDSLRIFSLVDQLSKQDAQSAKILPAREFILSSKEKAKAKEFASSGEKYKGQKHWEDLAEGIFFEGMESWMCWVAEDMCPILEVLQTRNIKSEVVWVQKNEIRQTAERIRDEEEDLAAALMESWEIPKSLSQPRLTASFEEAATPTATENTNAYLIDNLPPAKDSKLSVKSWGTFGAEVIKQLKELLAEGYQVSITCWSQESANRLRDALFESGLDIPLAETKQGGKGALISVAPISKGCIFPKLKFAILPEPQITKKQYNLPSKSKISQAPKSAWMGELAPGTYVVHKSHGIGRYEGTQIKKSGDGTEKEYLLIQYKGSDRLYLPPEQIGLLSLYGVGETPRLSSLTSNAWSRTKVKAKSEAMEIARELIELYGERNQIQGHRFSPDGAEHQDLAAKFPFLETPDQLLAIKDTIADMEKPVPMDRLIYGDVGFGKTEVAIRAAFKAISENKQAAVLVPTTLLARQHYQTFRERYMDFPVRVEMLSRLVSPTATKETIKSLATGEVDLVIGTHRLLSADIRFKDLGLLVVDEEQRFGVKQKEKIKSLHKNVDILTLTATPIPRTLEMSLTGIRDYSLIKTSPLERHPILTYVGNYDRLAVKEAIRRELLREGQVFFVHNRISSISQVHKELSELVPDAKIAVAHGRLNEVQLEKIVLDFTDKKYDVLLCTTIIEAGIDMPRVNTLVVDRAEALGLGQLHQLRGRVGRAGTQAYAYLFTNPDSILSSEAVERLRTIGEITALGSGFHLAMRDLEIRGAGSLLGFGQSGHITSVGYDMYCELVNDSVLELKGDAPVPKKEVVVDLPVEAHLPIDFVADETLRIDAYRKIFLADIQEIESIGEQWRDRFGRLPDPARQLLAIAKIRFLCQELGVESISMKNGLASLAPVSQSFIAKLNAMKSDDAEGLHNIARYDFARNELQLAIPNQNLTEEILEHLISLQAMK